MTETVQTAAVGRASEHPPKQKRFKPMSGKKRGQLIFLFCMLALPVLQWLILSLIHI